MKKLVLIYFWSLFGEPPPLNTFGHLLASLLFYASHFFTSDGHFLADLPIAPAHQFWSLFSDPLLTHRFCSVLVTSPPKNEGYQ